MILKEGKKKRRNLKYIWIPVLLLVLSVLILNMTKDDGKNSSDENLIFETIKCSAEKTDGNNFISDGLSFINGNTQTNQVSRTGKFSSLITAESKYSIGKSFTDFYEGQVFDASIWVKTKTPDLCYLVAQGNDKSYFYKSSNEPKETNGEWSKINLRYEVPINDHLKEIKIYGFYTGKKDTVYFDDLEIKYSVISAKNQEMDSLLSASLYLDNKALSKINKKRQKALELGILQSADDDWVTGKWTNSNSEETEVALRLKGDWTDHLRGKDWSFRIKFPSDQTWNRTRTFSVQHPKTRYYLSEWLFHQALQSQDVITPRYDFFWLTQNDDPAKLYAFEEHFEKQIAEYKNRREGVIVRFSEDGFWESRIRDKKYDTKLGRNYSYDNAAIYPFKEKKTLSSPKLQDQLVHAQNLLFSYQYEQVEIDQVFDVDKLAKYYALCDIFNAQHSVIWHNQRFYYNPISKLLEPIGFDGFTETGSYNFRTTQFFGAYQTERTTADRIGFYRQIFLNKDFAEKYYQYLIEFSSPEWVNKFYNDRKGKIENRKNLLETNYPNYKYKKSELFETAKKIQALIDPLEKFDIRVFEGDSMWNICNYFCLPIEIIGSCKKKNAITYFDEPIAVGSTWKEDIPFYDNIKKKAGQKYLVWRVLGEKDKNHFTEIKKWTQPEIIIAHNDLHKSVIPLNKSAYILEDNVMRIMAGNYKIETPLIIPKDVKLIVQSGVTIDLVNEAYVLVNGEIEMLGTKERPIIIKSTDGNSQGFHVLSNQQSAVLVNVKFDNLSNLTEGTWQMTGAVTIYEAKVKLNNVTISNNDCEDALNIIRSNVDISNLHINNTFADGFDCDFCTGYVRNSILHNTGNDGLDFSGSQLTLDRIKMKNIGDKGISAGEQASLEIFSAEIDGAAIGIASKDLSNVSIKYLDLKNCDKGFAAYQKKPEFGPGKIQVKSFNEYNVKTLILKEDKSEIIFEK